MGLNHLGLILQKNCCKEKKILKNETTVKNVIRQENQKKCVIARYELVLGNSCNKIFEIKPVWIKYRLARC